MIGVMVPSAFTETNSISIEVSSEKTNYGFGESIILQFEVEKYVPNTPVTIEIFREKGIEGLCKLRTFDVEINENGWGVYRLDIAGNESNLNAMGYAPTNCIQSSSSSSDYLINAYYGAQKIDAYSDVIKQYFGKDEIQITFSNELSNDSKKLSKIFPELMDIGTAFNPSDNFGIHPPEKYSKKFQIPKYILSKNYVHLEGHREGSLWIVLMEFENQNDAQKYVKQLSNIMPLSPLDYFDSKTNNFNEDGSNCKKTVSWIMGKSDTEILCNKGKTVFYIKESINGHKNTGIDEAYKSIIKKIPKETVSFDISVGDVQNISPPMVEAKLGEEKGGGCLIATATYGSEMAIEVQQLRELRDNQLLNTESGTQFMGMFNDVYYSFSPIIADYERENPYFKEAVKLAITPMISSLSLMENAESESEVLGIGISVIMLNIGMYLGVPAVVVIGIRKRF